MRQSWFFRGHDGGRGGGGLGQGQVQGTQWGGLSQGFSGGGHGQAQEGVWFSGQGKGREASFALILLL